MSRDYVDFWSKHTSCMLETVAYVLQTVRVAATSADQDGPPRAHTVCPVLLARPFGPRILIRMCPLGAAQMTDLLTFCTGFIESVETVMFHLQSLDELE